MKLAIAPIGTQENKKCRHNNRLSGTPSIGVEFAPRSGKSKLHDNRRVRLEALVMWPPSINHYVTI
jgi:hypothetical protein